MMVRGIKNSAKTQINNNSNTLKGSIGAIVRTSTFLKRMRRTDDILC
jgi:hypothetical protein